MKRSLLILPFALAVYLVAALFGQAGDNPIVEQAKQQLSDPKKPFTLVVVLTVKEGEGKQLEEMFKPAIKATRKEPGCITYDLNRDVKEANKYYVYERWKSVDALQQHVETDHFKTLLSKAPDVLAGAPEVKFFVISGE